VTKPTSPCACLTSGPRHPDIGEQRQIGVDPTDGRYADVALLRCARCGRLWLRYHVEYEAFSGSGRWAVAPIAEDEAAMIRPETAAAYLDSQEWYVYGGSSWGHGGKRGRGPLRWG
jgi:hypothetical protein